MGKPKNFGHSQFNHMALWRGSIDDVVPCPYDSSHVMKYARLQIHIIKCRKVFEKKNPELSKEFMICEYSTLHRFPKDQLEKHLQECKEYMMSVHSRVTAGKELRVQRKPDEVQTVSNQVNEYFDPEYVQEWI